MDKKIIIDPFDIKQLNPNSYNLRLFDELLLYKEKILGIKKINQFKKIKIPNDGILIYPEKLYLGRTVEFTETYDFIPMLEDRSSIGHLRLFTYTTVDF